MTGRAPERRNQHVDARDTPGHDGVVAAEARIAKYPPTRWMGSKEALLAPLWQAMAPIGATSALDLCSGSGVVAYMLKARGLTVTANDHMHVAATFARAMIENATTTLTEADLDRLMTPTVGDGFVARTFGGLYFDEADTAFIDAVRAHLAAEPDPVKQALVRAALARACLKKRPRGIFTYTGMRYDDGRRDLRLSLREQFLEQAAAVNAAVFDTGRPCRATCADALTGDFPAVDMVYLDPPYFSPLSDNEYVRRYHFVEGLARDWQGVEIQAHTKTRKFKSYPTPWRTEAGARQAFDALFERFRDSVLVVSYASNALPNRDDLAALMARHKTRVRVVDIPHLYSFGTQGHRVGSLKNAVAEHVFIGE